MNIEDAVRVVMRATRNERFTDDQTRRILLEGRLLLTNAQLCEKWGITAYRLRKWREAWDVRPSLEDLLIAAMQGGDWHEPASFVEYLDWRDHARYSPREVDGMLRNLLAWGDVETDGSRYRYVQREPPYVFGPRDFGG